MRRISEIAGALAALLLGSCAPKQDYWFRAAMNPAHRVEMTKPSALSEFVAARASSEVQSIWVTPVAPGLRFEPLSRLNGLGALTLSGFAATQPVGGSGSGIRFAVALTDQQVDEIARIGTLRAIALWYGSFSDAQRAVLKSRLPGVQLLENLNKL